MLYILGQKCEKCLGNKQDQNAYIHIQTHTDCGAVSMGVCLTSRLTYEVKQSNGFIAVSSLPRLPCLEQNYWNIVLGGMHETSAWFSHNWACNNLGNASSEQANNSSRVFSDEIFIVQ